MANRAQASTGATRLKSTRNKSGVYKSAIAALMPKERKSAARTSSSSKVSRVFVGKSRAPAPGENPAPVSDEEMTLSSEADRGSNGDTPAPFAKTSPLWEAVDSLEIFRKMPQCPHFRPLLSSRNEIIREGLAIAAMVNYSAVVKKISNFNLDEPASLLEDCLETLSDLETHGFVVEPIRKRADTLLSIKSTYDEVQDLSKQLIKEKEAMSMADEVIEDINEQIRRLEDQRLAAEEERATRDRDIRVLQEQFNEVREFVDSARSEFERVANAPW